jgi:putative membrane protein
VAEAQGARRMLILAVLLSLGAIATGAILWLL